MKEATTLTDTDAFEPHVTTTVTDPVKLPRSDPDMTAQGIWLPDLPYTFQRTATLSGTVPITSDLAADQPNPVQRLGRRTSGTCGGLSIWSSRCAMSIRRRSVSRC